MKHISIILALLILLTNMSFAQEPANERLDKIVEAQEKAKELKTLNNGWAAYKLEDYEAAFDLWLPLAEQENSSAQVLIGLMYSQGHAVEQNSLEAAKWYALAADQGHTPEKWRIAILYYHGNGVPQDYQKAAELYHSAAKQGDTYSQKALSVMYSNGFGVSKDNIVAYSWLHIARENGLRLAENYQLDSINEMTPEEISLAQIMAEDCMRSNYSKCGWQTGLVDNQIDDER